MALYQKQKGHAHGQAELEAAAFTQNNRSAYEQANNSTLDDSTPLGLLGGSVVAAKGPYQIGACNGDSEVPLGLLLNDVAGGAYENTPAVASGQGPYAYSMGAYETDIYETVPEGTSATPFDEIEYTEGEWLYCSPYGLLTNDSNGDTRLGIAVVTKAPTSTDSRLGFNLRI